MTTPNKITAAIAIAHGLFTAGLEVYSIVAGKKDLSEKELNDIIDIQNKAQEVKRAELLALIESTNPEEPTLF